MTDQIILCVCGRIRGGADNRYYYACRKFGTVKGEMCVIYEGSAGVRVSKELCTLLCAVPQWVRAVEMGVTVCTLKVKTGTAVSVHDTKVYSGVEVWLHLFVTPKVGVDE